MFWEERRARKEAVSCVLAPHFVDGVCQREALQVWERNIDPLVPLPWRQRIFMMSLI